MAVYTTHGVRRNALSPQRGRARPQAQTVCSMTVVCTPRQEAKRYQYVSKELQHMNTRQLSQAIARRLPNRTQDQVEEVLDTLAEVVEEQLSLPGGYIYIHGLGRIHVDHQFLQPTGIFEGRYRPGWTLLRIYFRFQPSRDLKEAIRSALDSAES